MTTTRQHRSFARGALYVLALLCLLCLLAAGLTQPARASEADETGAAGAEEAARPEDPFSRDEAGNRYYIAPGAETRTTGWLKLDGRWYCFDADGLMITGWYKSAGGYWYYLDPDTGAMHTGWTQTPDGKWYLLGADGARRVGWYKSPGGYWYYLDPATGAMRTGWFQAASGYWYYLDPDTGAMRTGWVQATDGKWYYLGTDGARRVGWYKSPGGYWYYLDPTTGAMHTGWLEWGDAVYFLREGGQMATNWYQIGDWWYFFGSDGARRVGWLYRNGNYYYLYERADNPEGAPVGANAHDTYIQGRAILSNGRVEDGPKYYMQDICGRYSSATNYLILVDTTACRVGIFSRAGDGWSMLKYWSCSPGTSSTPTVKGSFTVGNRGYAFDSGIYRCYYYTQFYGNYLFHSVLYDQTGYNSASHIQDGRLGQRLSHGCVRLDIDNAYWIYSYIPSGTRVVVY